MSYKVGGLSGFLLTVLVVLIFGAVFGVVEWSMVGRFAKLSVIIFITGVVLSALFYLWFVITKKKN